MPTMRLVRVIRNVALANVLALFVAIQPGVAAADLTKTAQFNIAPQLLSDALVKYTEQSGVQVTSRAEILEGKSSLGVTGSLSVRAALERVLTGTDLSYDIVGPSTVTIRAASGSATSPSGSLPSDNSGGRSRLAQSQDIGPSATTARPDEGENTGEQPDSESTLRGGIPEVLVTGSKILNTDIRRTRDDPQPYVVFDNDVISRSSATNVEDFLKQRLPMNTAVVSNGQGIGNSEGNRSEINLRGLGTNQTLILIDGRRAVGVAFAGGPGQPDLNAIPLAMIERIEVLPTTASGIYGGGATGGVINIIRRRDYEGTSLKLTYENVFESDAARRGVDLGAGFSLEEGRTHVTIVGNWSDQGSLANRDRDFILDYRTRAFANDPAAFLPPNEAPFGATPNIRSATSVDGVVQPLTFDNGTPLNATFATVPAGYAGFASDGGAGLLANAGRYNLDLADTLQAGNLLGAGVPIFSAPTVKSLTTTVHREFTPSVEAFVELGASENDTFSRLNILPARFFLPAAAPANPFQQDIEVTVPTNSLNTTHETSLTNRRILAGLIAKLPWSWQAEADYSWQRSSLSSSLPIAGLTPEGFTALDAAIQDGEFNILRDTIAFPVDYAPFGPTYLRNHPRRTTLRNARVLLGGPVGSLPAGAPMLSVKLEHQEELIDDYFVDLPFASLTRLLPNRSQSVASAYLEARLPLVSARNRRPGVQELELQVAARHDEYTTHGVTGSVVNPTPESIAAIQRNTTKQHSTNPTVSLRWKPVADLALRASFGTGFLPPTVNQVLPSISATPREISDPRRGNTQYTLAAAQHISGGNSDIVPEESESLSAGVIFTPRAVEGLRLSVDYTRIEKTDNIVFFPGLSSESLYPDRVVRGPRLPGDPPDWAGPITFLDETLINIASAEVEAYDAQLDYTWETAGTGTFSFYALGTWQTHYRTQDRADQPVVENVGFGNASFPLKVRANAGLTWQYQNWTLGWSTRYYDSYFPYGNSASDSERLAAVLIQGAEKVESQVLHDAFATYRFGTPPGGGDWKSSLFSDVEMQLGIRNVFNTKPAFDISTGATPFSSWLGDVRLATYSLQVSKNFGR